MRILHGTAALMLAALVSEHAVAQTQTAADLARRTFMNAEQLLREGKTDQAIRDFQHVIQTYPESQYADDALMKVGSFHYPPDTISDLGKVPVRDQESVRSYFDQVRERYAQSDSAPQACYKLGLLDLEPDSPRRNLDEAYASFYSVVNIYPESDWVGRALLGAAVAEMGKREYDRAILSLERSLDESPHGAAAAEAHFFTGLANVRLGEFVRAAESFQACRLEDAKGRAAGRALDWLTLIYRMRLRAASINTSLLAHDPSFVPRVPPGEDLRGGLDLAVSPEGKLLVADPRRGAILQFAATGALEKIETLQEPSRIAVDGEGGVLVASPSLIRVSGVRFPAARKAGSSVRPIERPGGVWRTTSRELYVLDLGEGELLRYGADPENPTVVHSDRASGTRTAALSGGPEDRLYLLDSKARRILASASGTFRPFADPQAGAMFEEPVDLTVSQLGDVYVLDAKTRGLVILDAKGALVAKIVPAAGSPGELPDASAVAVGPQGEVYVHDLRKRTILRYR
jgi:TolA-binding protein